MRISDWSSDVCSSDLVNARRITNVGTFRAYMNAYLKDRGDMADGMFLVVRQLAPTETGLPLEIYAYTANTSWAVHEDVQGDTRSEEHTSELQSLMRISYAVFCLKKTKTNYTLHNS